MTSVLQRTRRIGIALALAFGLAVLPGIIVPLMGDELVNVLPGITEVSAEETQGSGG
jgi:hypothetical protein